MSLCGAWLYSPPSRYKFASFHVSLTFWHWRRKKCEWFRGQIEFGNAGIDQKFLGEIKKIKYEERDCLGDQGIDGDNTITGFSHSNRTWGCGWDSASSGYLQEEGQCKEMNKPVVSINCDEFMNHYKLSKKGSVFLFSHWQIYWLVIIYLCDQ